MAKQHARIKEGDLSFAFDWSKKKKYHYKSISYVIYTCLLTFLFTVWWLS